MKKMFTILLLFTLTIIGCDRINELLDSFDKPISEHSSFEADTTYLSNLRQEIISLSESEFCESSDNWKWTALGSKPCGGPWEYIIYSTSIDTVKFLLKVDQYTNDQEKLNQKWGLASDCMFVGPPNAIDCVDGKPELMYN